MRLSLNHANLGCFIGFMEKVVRNLAGLSLSQIQEMQRMGEAELREELGEFEVVEDGTKGEEKWEEEIQNMMDEEENQDLC
mgnify:CR=1 FL=1